MTTPAPLIATDTNAPDGAAAWRMVVAAFISGFVVFGIVYSFGVFLPPMMTAFHASRVEASAFYAIASVVWYFAGPLTGYLGDRFGPRFMAGAGAVAMGASLALTACIEQLWVGYLIYGLGVGMGAACAYVPTLANLGGWFVKKRNTAFSIAAAGTGCGMLIVPPLSAKLIEMAGWQFANVVLGAGSFLLLAASALMLAPPPLAQQAPSGRPLRPVLCSFEFVMMYLSWVLATTALFVPFVFLPQFAVSQGADPVAASALISVLGAASVLGRLCAGMLGKWINNLTLFKGAVLFMAASYIVWLTMPAYWSLVGFAIVLGTAYGIRIALVPSVLIEFFGVRDLGTILGIFFTATGFASIIGPMVAGYVVDISGSYQWGIAFAAAMGMLGFAAIALSSRKAASVDAVAKGLEQDRSRWNRMRDPSGA